MRKYLYFRENSNMVKLEDVNRNPTIVGFCRWLIGTIYFGIKTLAGAPFLLQKDFFCPIFVHQPPFEEKGGLHKIVPAKSYSVNMIIKDPLEN